MVIPPRYSNCFKGPQARLAETLGLTTVQSLVTNDLEAAKRFVGDHEQVIAKPLGNPYIPVGRDKNTGDTDFLMMRPVNVDVGTLDGMSEIDFAKTPLFLQKRIRKKYEIRCHIINGHCIAVKLPSNDTEYTQLDWRWGSKTLNFQPLDLDERVVNALRAFNQKMGLIYGVFDLIVDENDEHLFLECNPDGNWLWLDECVGGQLVRSYAQMLADASINLEKRSDEAA